MKTQTKNKILGLMPNKMRLLIKAYKKFHSSNPDLKRWQLLLYGKIVYASSRMDYMDDYVRQMKVILGKVRINIEYGYVYPFDSLVFREITNTPICSITVDFGTVLTSDLNEIRLNINNAKDERFKNRELNVLNNVESLSRRIEKELGRNTNERQQILRTYFQRMLYGKPLSLDEALQKLLFYNAMFWQMRHNHIGLGRLDLILWPYYDNDIRNGVLTENTARELIRNFILVLGKDTRAKSLELNGDTGQYIMLGGIDQYGKGVNNPLTSLFIDLFAELKIPDPKLILRVNEETNDEVWSKSIRCISTGIGSPLIMNENVIIKKMIEFGYQTSDVWNVGTSACWEPLIIGKSFDQNNPFKSADAVTPLNNIILSSINYQHFEDLLVAYKNEYSKEIKGVVKDINFDCSPLFSLFFEDCINREKDYTAGGAKYAYHGAQIVGLPNAINALLNIKDLVYNRKLYSLEDCKKAIIQNFRGMEDFQTLLETLGKKFGSTDAEVLELTNDLIQYTGVVVKSLKSNGNPVKVGFSSPSYIFESKKVLASLDGRKKGFPYAVHISPSSSNIDLSEVLDFAAHLEYRSNCINGNVVDFILPVSYIKQPEKLIGILKNACSRGIFELQLNVLDKATLVDAKVHPEKYPNLIVRVWGFSAYFNDLPEDFKDNLIQRAGLYECA